MNGQVRQAGKAIAKVCRALRDTQEGEYNCLSIAFTTKFIGCSCNVPCLHAPEVHSKFDSGSGLGQTCY